MGKKVVSENVRSFAGSKNIEFQIPSNELTGVYYVIVNGEKAGSAVKK